ncbi:MAG: filamentous hemagglutinin N-terminal domain-containing protein, partial [Proteobacteria bacterium]|nr:filamentous hemagglutinin N-terminal domain-containing protein [Pseudomonadota bacterium]
MKKLVSLAAASALFLTPTLTMAQQLPTGGSVAAGNATITSPNGSTLNVNQTSNRAIVNWRGFSVGSGATVNFNQPGASSATLNRVTGSTPSSIAGTINAPGTVLLVNPNGIAITKSGVVNVGSFAASTLDIKDSDFMSGKYTFSGNGSSAGVVNAGRINVSDGGFAALLGGQVANDGVIAARLGKVGLGSGELITLDLAGDGFLSVAVPTKSLNGLVGSDGHPLVSNKGKIRADGGTVYLSAATAAGLLRDAVNVPGSIRANSVGTRDGKIVIGGGVGGKVKITGKVGANGGKTAKGGTIDISGAHVAVSGKVKANGADGGSVKIKGAETANVTGEASAKGSTGKGGVVIISADDVTLGATAKLDVSGPTGGLLLIGGDYQGGANAANNFSIETIDTALTTTIAAGATLTAEGTNGQGGKIVVWSDNLTTFAGVLDVSGTNGSGGFAEVSGHRLLEFTGTANLAGTAGPGTLLLDPLNVVISNGATAYGALAGGTFTPSSNNSVLNVSTLQAALASGNVIVTTGGAGSAGSDAGDITVANNVTWSANTLTLQAYHSIYVNATMAATGTAGLTLTTNNGGTGGTITYGGHVTFANTSQSLSIDGANYTLIDSMSALQNINNGLTGNYALIKSLDASSVTNWVPLGTDSAGNLLNSSLGFSGKFTGLGNAISNLTINLPSGYPVGLFGRISNTSVSNLNLANLSVTGSGQVGGLIGNAYNSLIADVNVSGTVTGNSYVGGVVGMGNLISIVDTHADVIVRANGNGNAGGLLGWSSTSSSIARSSVTGSVSALGSYVGGLAGYMSGSVTDSYSTAAVSSNSQYVGGLVGGSPTSSNLAISTSWSSGLVTAPSSAGGIIGAVGGTFTFSNVYWDTQTSGQAYALGGSTSAISGTTGLTTAQARRQSSYSGFDFTNVWYMVNDDTRPFLRSEYSTNITNAHQLQLVGMNAKAAGSYTLAKDINLGAALSNAAEMWGSSGWVPIGSLSSNFNGTFDGQNHIIDGLTINRSTTDQVG